MRIPLSMLDFPFLSLTISHSLRPQVMRTDENPEDFDDMDDEMFLNHICWLDMRR